jgi:nitroreductase
VSAVTVCFVTFDPDLELLSEVISRLLDALRYAATKGALTEARLIVVDNGPKSDQAVALQTLPMRSLLATATSALVRAIIRLSDGQRPTTISYSIQMF